MSYTDNISSKLLRKVLGASNRGLFTLKLQLILCFYISLDLCRKIWKTLSLVHLLSFHFTVLQYYRIRIYQSKNYIYCLRKWFRTGVKCIVFSMKFLKLMTKRDSSTSSYLRYVNVRICKINSCEESKNIVKNWRYLP